MQQIDPIPRQDLPKKQAAKYTKLSNLIQGLQEKALTDTLSAEANRIVGSLNALESASSDFKKQLPKAYNDLVKVMMKESNYVTKDYYKELWMVLGMSSIGMPIGVAFGFAIGNMAFLALGLPIGMLIGRLMGSQMDLKAEKEGRQIVI